MAEESSLGQNIEQNIDMKTAKICMLCAMAAGLLGCSDSNARKEPARPESKRAVESGVVISTLVKSMVTIPGKGYKMGKYEVTQAQWEAVMGTNPSKFKSENNPVEKVSWNDCQEFLKKLNAVPEVKSSGLFFRLPTEAEWEHACRAGSAGDYCKLTDGAEVNEETLGDVAWFRKNSHGETHPVGKKKPNAYGLYDVLGNVGEWTLATTGSVRVFRGGSWTAAARHCACASGDELALSARFGHIGFRLLALNDVAQAVTNRVKDAKSQGFQK